MSQLDVLYEDNHLLVVNKPAGIATMGAEAGQPTIHQMAADYLKLKYNKPGNVFVGVVSRLDTMTSGALVLARTSKAASRLVPQFGGAAQGKQAASVVPAEKIYLAAVAGTLDRDVGTLVDYVRKDDAARRMRVVSESMTDAKRAELQYAKIASADDATTVAIRLKSGRKHQIRLQFAERGHAVIGDRKYGSKRPFPLGVALHSWRLTITHPTLRTVFVFQAKLPSSWQQFASVLPDDLEIANVVEAQFGARPAPTSASNPEESL